MFKELLQDVIMEKYLDGKITAEKFDSLIEKSELVTEEKAFQILGEVKFGIITEDWKQSAMKGLSTVGQKVAKYTGVERLVALHGKEGALKILKAQLANAPKGSEKAKNISKEIRKVWLQTGGIAGAQAGAAGLAGYGAYKVATRKK